MALPSIPKITMYVTDWCPYCKSTQRFLNNKSVPYEVVNIEQDDTAAEYVMQHNNGNRTVPTLEIEGKGVYTNPSPQQLTQILELI